MNLEWRDKSPSAWHLLCGDGLYSTDIDEIEIARDLKDYKHVPDACHLIENKRDGTPLAIWEYKYDYATEERTIPHRTLLKIAEACKIPLWYMHYRDRTKLLLMIVAKNSYAETFNKTVFDKEEVPKMYYSEESKKTVWMNILVWKYMILLLHGYTKARAMLQLKTSNPTILKLFVAVNRPKFDADIDISSLLEQRPYHLIQFKFSLTKKTIDKPQKIGYHMWVSTLKVSAQWETESEPNRTAWSTGESKQNKSPLIKE